MIKGSQKTDKSLSEVQILLGRWMSSGQKTSDLVNGVDEALPASQRAKVLGWFESIIRNYGYINAIIAYLSEKEPKSKLRLFLICGIAEILREPKNFAKVVHFTVEESKRAGLSKSESNYINAVLRKTPDAIKNLKMGDEKWSHPLFLIDRWKFQFAWADTQALLEWNQSESYNLFYSESKLVDLKPSRFLNYYRLETAQDWKVAKNLIEKGQGYIRDPATQHPVDLLSPRAGESILDLCSAPGGKAVQIINSLGRQGKLTAVDLPGKRFEQLKKNLNFFSSSSDVKLIDCDLFDLEKVIGKEAKFDAILLDVPCSNTGILRRKPDIKYRLTEKDFVELPKLQLAMLSEASKWLKNNGRIVYSTCSLEMGENRSVVEKFIKIHPRFRLSKEKISFPPKDLHDGGGAFLLTKSQGSIGV